MKNKITISISHWILSQIDKKIDKKTLKNRSSVIESLVRKWLELKEDVWALILAHDDNWNDWIYKLDIPKVLIKVDSKTLLEKHIEYLKNAKVTKIVISVWDKKQQIIDFINSKKFTMEIIFLEVNKADLSLWIISKSKQILNTNKILTILWDNYFYPLDLTDFIYYHNSNNSELSIIVKSVNSSDNYWNIKMQWNNIIEFMENPKNNDDFSNLINSWIYLLNSDIIPDRIKNLKIETDFFPEFVKNKRVKAYFHSWKYFHMQDNKTLFLFN